MMGKSLRHWALSSIKLLAIQDYSRGMRLVLLNWLMGRYGSNVVLSDLLDKFFPVVVWITL